MVGQGGGEVMNSETPILLYLENGHYFLFRGRPRDTDQAEHYGAVLNAEFDCISYTQRDV